MSIFRKKVTETRNAGYRMRTYKRSDGRTFTDTFGRDGRLITSTAGSADAGFRHARQEEARRDAAGGRS